MSASVASRLFAGGQRLLLAGRNERPQIPCAACGSPSLFVRNGGSSFEDKGEPRWPGRARLPGAAAPLRASACLPAAPLPALTPCHTAASHAAPPRFVLFLGPDDFWCSRACAAEEEAESYEVSRFWNSPRAGVCGYDGPQDPEDEEDLWEDDDSQEPSGEWTTDDGESGGEQGGDESAGGGQAAPASAQKRTRAGG